MELKINAAKLTPALMVAYGKEFPKGTAAGLNRTAQQAKTQASALVRARYNLRKGDLDRSIRAGKKATATTLQTSVRASGRRIPLIDFGARGTMPSRKGTIGVSVEVVKGRRVVSAGTFLAVMKSGHKGVFIRSGKFGRRGMPKLERIQEQTGPSVPQMFFSTKVYGKLKQYVAEVMPKNIAAAIQYLKR